MADTRKAKEATGRGLATALNPRLTADKARTKMRMAEIAAVAAGAAGVPGGAPAAFIAAVMDASPYLRSLILDDPSRLAAILADDPQARLGRIASATADAWQGVDEASLMAKLRHAREEVALVTALADLGGVWDVRQVTAALT